MNVDDYATNKLVNEIIMDPMVMNKLVIMF